MAEATVAASEPVGTAEPGSTEAPLPFNMATPALVIERPTEPAHDTPAGPPVVLPPGSIQIYRPGPGSQVTSPFQVYGRAGPSFKERVWIRLVGEDGREIARRLTILLVYPGQAGNFVAHIEFETPFVAEAARLEVSTEDLRYGRMSQLASVELVLLSAGKPLIRPALDGPQKLAIFEPRDGAVIEGGLVHVRGGGWVDSELPITVELLDRNGNPLDSRQILLDAPAPGQLGTFELDLSFQLQFSQYARVAVYEQSAGIPGAVHYSSVEVWLQR